VQLTTGDGPRGTRFVVSFPRVAAPEKTLLGAGARN
jgi:hypothetical protein